METFLPLTELVSTKRAHHLLNVCVVAFDPTLPVPQSKSVGHAILSFVNHQLSHLTVRVEHRQVVQVVQQIASVGSYEQSRDLVKAFNLSLSIWQRAITPLNVKKRFELFLQHLFVPICSHISRTQSVLVDAANTLPSFALSALREEEIMLQPLTASARSVMDLLRNVLFDASHVSQFASSFTRWQDRWEKLLEQPRKKKRKRNDLLVSYHRLLLERLEKGLASSESNEWICGVLPGLLNLFSEAIIEGKGESVARKREVSGEGDGNATTNTTVFAFYYEIVSLVVSSALPLEVRHECFAKITLVLLRSRIYDTSNEKMLGALKEMLPGFMADLTSAGSGAKDAVVCSFIALLELDHRVLEDDMEALVSGLCESFVTQDVCVPVNSDAGFTFDASVELVLRVIHEYSKLRRMERIVELCLRVPLAASGKPDLLLLDSLQDGLGKIWRSMPPTQYPTQWRTLMQSLEERATERTCMWFHVFCLAVNVEHNNAKDIFQNCDKTLELLNRLDGAPPQLLLTTTLHELKQLCHEMDDTLPKVPILYERWEHKLQLEESSNHLDAKARACILLMRHCKEAPLQKLCSFVVKHASFSLLCANVDLVATNGDAALVKAMVERMIDDFDLDSHARVARSPFIRARFYEIGTIREQMGEALATRLERLVNNKQQPELKRTLQLIAAMPRNYLSKTAITRVVSAVLGTLEDDTKEDVCAVLYELGQAQSGILSSIIKQKRLRALVIPQHKFSENLVKRYSKDLLQQDRTAAKFARNAKAIVETNLVDLAVACLEPFIAHLKASSEPLPTSVHRLIASLWLRTSPTDTGDEKADNFELYAMLLRVATTGGERVDSELSTLVIEALSVYTSNATVKVLSTEAGRTDRIADESHGSRLLNWKAPTHLIATAALAMPQLPTKRSGEVFTAIADAIFPLLRQTIEHHTEQPQASSNLDDALRYLFQGCSVPDQTNLLLAAIEEELRCDGAGDAEAELRVATGLRACKIAFDTLAHGTQKRQAVTGHAQVLVKLIVDAASAHPQLALEVLEVAYKRFPEWFSSKRNEELLVYVVIGLVGVLTQGRESESKETLNLVLNAFTMCIRLNSAALIKMAVAVVQLSQHVVRAIVEKELECAPAFERFSQELATHGKAFKHYAVHWLVAYVDTCRRSTIPPGLRAALDAAAFHWIDMCQDHELQQIHAILRSTNRLIFKDLHENYDRMHKYRGTV